MKNPGLKPGFFLNPGKEFKILDNRPYFILFSYICKPAHVAKLVNVAVSEAVGVRSLGVRVSPWAHSKKEFFSSFFLFLKSLSMLTHDG